MRKSITTIFACFCMISMLHAQPATPSRLSDPGPGAMHSTKPKSGWHDSRLNPLQQWERIQQMNRFHDGLDAAPNSQHRLDSVVSAMDTKDEYLYDSYNRLTQEVGYFYDPGLNPWIPSFKIEYTYTLSGTMDYQIESEYDVQLSLWIPYSKINYTYDSIGFLSQEFQSYWNDLTNLWETNQRSDYSYNSFGDLSLELIYENWLGYWELMGKNEYLYNAGNQLNQMIFSFYDSYISAWEPTMKIEYTYFVNGNLATSIEFYYEYMLGTWEPFQKTDYAYDALGNVLTETWYDYNLLTSSWEPSWKFEVVYNLSIPFADLVVPFWYRWNYMITSAGDFIWTNNQWVPVWNLTLYYSLQTSREPDRINKPSILVRPNPASDYMYLDFMPENGPAVVSIYDMQGRQVFSKALNGENQISLKALKPALYLYILQDGGNTYRGKFVKE